MAEARRAHRVAQVVSEVMYGRDTSVRLLGISLDEVGPGFARMTMGMTAEMTNGIVIGHGGLVFTLADTCFAYACNAYNHAAVASHCDIAFLAPTKVGDVLTAVAEERYRHGRSGVYDVTVTNQDGIVVAMFRGHSRRVQGDIIADIDERLKETDA